MDVGRLAVLDDFHGTSRTDLHPVAANDLGLLLESPGSTGLIIAWPSEDVAVTLTTNGLNRQMLQIEVLNSIARNAASTGAFEFEPGLQTRNKALREGGPCDWMYLVTVARLRETGIGCVVGLVGFCDSVVRVGLD